jgi:hypothetical protein
MVANRELLHASMAVRLRSERSFRCSLRMHTLRFTADGRMTDAIMGLLSS